MKLETLFEKFDQFADAPDAVEKIRELIRNFAVRGRLVFQDPDDEPAEALIARVAAALGDKKSENPFLGEIEDSIIDESKFELPPGWAWLPLGYTGIWATGCGFPLQYQGATDGEFLFCKVSDMNLPSNKVEIHTTVHSIDADVMKKIRARANPVGTVIFPKIGGAIATHKRRLVIKPTIIDNNCSGIQPIGLTDDRWLLLLMRSLDLTKYQSGTSVPAVSQGSLDPIRIGLPPLAEQKRIVAKVDELMVLCDRLEAQQQERETRHAALARASLARFADAPTPVNLDFLFHQSYAIAPADLRKSILTLAVQGKLVPQDPNDEPAEGIIRRADAERLRSDPEEEVKEPIAEEELPWSLPVSWKWVRLGDIANIRHGYAFSSESFTSEPTSFVLTTPGNFYESGGFRDRGANTKYFKGEVPPAFVFKAGDLVIPMTEQAAGLLGSPAFIPDDGKTYLHNQRLGKLQFYTDDVSREFVFSFFNSEFFRGELARTCTGMKVRHTSPNRVLRVPFPLPPLAEQRRIVAKVEGLMTLVNALETHLDTFRLTAAGLTAAAIHELTNGKEVNVLAEV